MILKRGAWHRFHRLAIMGVSTWGPLSSLEVSDGMCLWCAPPPAGPVAESNPPPGAPSGVRTDLDPRWAVVS